MRFPNKYGSIVKLGGKRRKPYAVRITTGYRDYVVLPNKKGYYPLVDKYAMKYRKATNDYITACSDDIMGDLSDLGLMFKTETKQQFKYLEYFEKSSDAAVYLARMNSDQTVQKHMSIASEPSFKEVYEQYIDFIGSLNNKPTESRLRSYKTGFNLWSDVHDLRFKAITTQQLQKCLTKRGTMSKASVGRMGTILKRMYKYAISNQICDTDLSPYLFAEYKEEPTTVHTVFTDDEIALLWDKSRTDDMAKVALLLIYTGLRCSEFLQLENDNIHIKDRYMIGGMKTDAGKNRTIPIHKKIVPIVKYFYDPNNEYFFPNKKGGIYTYGKFRTLKWDKAMERFGLHHLTHDCRYTCATKLESAKVDLLHRKLILGHTIRDITEGTYTKVDRKALVKDIDLWV